MCNFVRNIHTHALTHTHRGLYARIVRGGGVTGSERRERMYGVGGRIGGEGGKECTGRWPGAGTGT